MKTLIIAALAAASLAAGAQAQVIGPGNVNTDGIYNYPNGVYYNPYSGRYYDSRYMSVPSGNYYDLYNNGYYNNGYYNNGYYYNRYRDEDDRYFDGGYWDSDGNWHRYRRGVRHGSWNRNS